MTFTYVDAAPRVLVTARNLLNDSMTPAALRAGGFDVVVSETLERDQRGTVAALVVGTNAVGSEELDLLPALRVVLRAGAGLDNIDVGEAERRGVRVANLPGINTESVADHTLALMLAVMHAVPGTDRALRDGVWRAVPTTDLAGKVLGILGTGKIGSAVAQRAWGFGVKVLALAKPGREGESRLGAPALPLGDLLPRCDVISLHLPLTAETRHLIGATELAALPDRAFLVNTARGGLVDSAALREALLSGSLAGVGLDVFESEPESARLFTGLDNAVISPHHASYGDTTRGRLAEAVTQTLSTFFFDGGIHPK